MTDPREITEVLRRWNVDKKEASDRLFPLVYAQLQRLASSRLRSERRGHTLQTTDLVHEAYLRMVDQSRVEWQDRNHFFAIAARAMRRVLVDHARRHAAAKRIHPNLVVTLDQAVGLTTDASVDVLALDEGLKELARIDPRQARIVELRAFVGLTQDETAEVLGVSGTTIYREWRVAKLWLKGWMTPETPDEPVNGDSP
jgi:RNA polymerase sigma-70 factor (ECF subfamily)